MFGWQGKVLRVDLGKGEAVSEEIKSETYLNFLGGNGLGVNVLSSEVAPDIHPLAPENKIVIATGPLTGTGASGASVCAIVTKSALTNTLVSAQAKLYFGSELKAAGYDAIIIEGRAERPVVLSIRDDKVSLLPAEHLVEQNTDTVEALIRCSINDPWVARETRILSIGPAGEKQFPIAALVTDGFLIPNSVGVGAVFGSKKVKAIAVRGTKDVFLHDGKAFFERVLESATDFSQNDKLKVFSHLSTYHSFETLLKANGIPCCYFTKPYQVNFSLAEIKSLWERERGCFSCPVACLKATQKGKFLPEIDALTALGPLCGIHDISAIFDAYDLCVKTGLDPVETGATLACLMKLGKEGALEKENLEIEPKFGDKEALLKLLAFIGKGEKGSSALGKGAYQLSQHLQKPDLFMGVRGRSVCFDVTTLPYLGLQYATSNAWSTYLTGPAFLDKGLKREEIADKVKLVQDKTVALEAMGICPYVANGFALDIFLSMFQAATGIALEKADLLKIGETICNLEREFAQKAGVNLETDTLPEKISPSGFKELIDKYYQLRGWK